MISVLVLSGFGINCEMETAYAFELFGAKADIVHINDIISGEKKLIDYQILAFPGGFSYGDHMGAGKALANTFYNHLQEQFLEFLTQDRLVLGMCNGFQILSQLGVFPTKTEAMGTRTIALMQNKQARYTCRWVWVKNVSQKCIFTQGIDVMPIPIAHGEGRLYAPSDVIDTLFKNDQVVFQYCDEFGTIADEKFPINPNGALKDIAGICDPSGKIFGLMPHPERYLFSRQYPDFPRRAEEARRQGIQLPEEGIGQKIFQNALSYFA